MTPLEALKIAKSKIEVGWTQRCTSRNTDSIACAYNDPDAKCWCAMGAVACATPLGEWDSNRKQCFFTDNVEGFELRDKAYAYLAKAIGCATRWGIPVWNDDAARTKDEVLALFDKAIVLAEADETAPTSEPVAATVSEAIQ